MSPTTFPQANCRYGAPAGMDETQVSAIAAYRGTIQGGNLDGIDFATVAWLPSPTDLERLKNGEAIYLTMLGGLSPHCLTTSFDEAVRL